MVVVDTVLGLYIMDRTGFEGKVQSKALSSAVGCIVLGRVFWELENRLCTAYPQVWPFHIVWHVCSGCAAYYSLLANYLVRMPLDKKKNQNEYPQLFLFEIETNKKLD